MVKDKQVRRLFAMKNKCKTLYQLADKAGISTKTARKYLKTGVLPANAKLSTTGPPIRMPLQGIGHGLKNSSKTTPVLNLNRFLRLCSVNIPVNTRTAN